MEQQKKKFHLTTSEKVIIGCTVAVVVAGVIVYKERVEIEFKAGVTVGVDR